MAKKRTSTEPAKADENRSPSWNIYARIDPDLQKPVEAYINSRDYPPALARVIERALKMLLTDEGLWPPKGEPAD